MDESLLAQGLRVTELLLEAVGEPAQLGPALHAMTRLMDADLGMLASSRRSDAGAGTALMATRSGSYSGQDADLAFPALRCYRRWGALQPAGRLHRESEIRRLAQEQDGAGTADDEATPDQTELSEVRWFTKAEARDLMAGKIEGVFAPGKMAIAHQLIKAWAESED